VVGFLLFIVFQSFFFQDENDKLNHLERGFCVHYLVAFWRR
jgi:hypothetical protein